MKPRSLLILLAGLALALVLSACSGSLSATSWPGLTVADDTAYLAYNNHVYAIDLNTRTEKWRFPTKDEAERNITFYAPPAQTPDGQLIVGDYANTLYSLNPDAASAAERVNWRFEGAEGRFIGSPLVTEEGIFAPNADGNLYALDLDGRILWPPFHTQQAQWATPASDGERIYIPSMDHRLYAVDLKTGSEIWSTDLSGAMVDTPALSDDGWLYIGTFGSELIALNSEDGTEVWRLATKGWVWSGPGLNSERLYVGDLEGTFYAVDRLNGTVIWERTFGSPIADTPFVTEEAIYLTTEEGSVIALDKNGKTLWTQTVDGKIYALPIPYDDLLLVPITGGDTLLVALTTSGAQSWAFTPEE